MLQQGTVELVEPTHESRRINCLIAVLLHFRDGTLIGQKDCMGRDLRRQRRSVGALTVNSDSQVLRDGSVDVNLFSRITLVRALDNLSGWLIMPIHAY